MKLHKTDQKLLNLLQQNARITTKKLAQELNLTITPVFERIKRLENQGFITRYVALANKEKLGKQLTAFCNVSLKEHTKEVIKNFERRILMLPEVMECHHIAGLHDYMLKVVTEDMESYHNFIYDKLTAIDNIGNVRSSFVMKEIKYTTAFPVE
jgi:Lrp/AsnC family leucine-responsive transcriptional regulator